MELTVKALTQKSSDEYHRQDAIAAANFVNHLLFHRHRGVLDCGDKFVIFGNDGYDSDPRARYEVAVILAAVEELGWKDFGFGKQSPDDQDGSYSWAIVVYNYERKSVDLGRLHDIVYQAWDAACNGEPACDLPDDEHDQGGEEVPALRLFSPQQERSHR